MLDEKWGVWVFSHNKMSLLNFKTPVLFKTGFLKKAVWGYCIYSGVNYKEQWFFLSKFQNFYKIAKERKIMPAGKT